jgi:hypothetical protein
VLSVETLFVVGLFVGKIATIAAIPIIYIWLGGLAYLWLRRRDRVATIAAVPLTHVGGLVVGLALLRFSPHAEVYDVDHIFGNPGPWSIDFFNFLMYRANPWAYPWEPLYSTVLSGPVEWMRQIFATVIAAFGGVLPAKASIVLPLNVTVQSFKIVKPSIRRRIAVLAIFGRPDELARGILFCLGAMLWTAYLVMYAINVLYWSLNSANFWALLIAAFVYQKYRHSR